MAKKAVRGERSQAVRDYLATNPDAGPNEVVAALSEKGVTVKAGLVSAVKYKKAPGAKAGRRGRQKAQADVGTLGNEKVTMGVAVDNGISVANLMEAKKLVDTLGGIEQAKLALATLEQLR